MAIDWTKPVRYILTGEIVDYVTTDFIVKFPNGNTSSIIKEHLENVPEPRFLWINVYKSLGFHVLTYNSREDAKKHKDSIFTLCLNLDTGEVVSEKVNA